MSKPIGVTTNNGLESFKVIVTIFRLQQIKTFKINMIKFNEELSKNK